MPVILQPTAVPLSASDRSPLKNLSRFTVRHFARSIIGDNIKVTDLANVIDSTIDNPRGSVKKQFAAQEATLTGISKSVSSVKSDTVYIRKAIDRIEKRLKQGGSGGPPSAAGFLAAPAAAAEGLAAYGVLRSALPMAGRILSRSALPVAAALGLSWLLTTKSGHHVMRTFAGVLDNIKKGHTFMGDMDRAASNQQKQPTLTARDVANLTQNQTQKMQAILSGGQGNLDRRMKLIKEFQDSLKTRSTISPKKTPIPTFRDTGIQNSKTKNSNPLKDTDNFQKPKTGNAPKGVGNTEKKIETPDRPRNAPSGKETPGPDRNRNTPERGTESATNPRTSPAKGPLSSDISIPSYVPKEKENTSLNNLQAPENNPTPIDNSHDLQNQGTPETPDTQRNTPTRTSVSAPPRNVDPSTKAAISVDTPNTVQEPKTQKVSVPKIVPAEPKVSTPPAQTRSVTSTQDKTVPLFSVRSLDDPSNKIITKETQKQLIDATNELNDYIKEYKFDPAQNITSSDVFNISFWHPEDPTSIVTNTSTSEQITALEYEQNFVILVASLLKKYPLIIWHRGDSSKDNKISISVDYFVPKEIDTTEKVSQAKPAKTYAPRGTVLAQTASLTSDVPLFTMPSGEALTPDATTSPNITPSSPETTQTPTIPSDSVNAPNARIPRVTSTVPSQPLVPQLPDSFVGNNEKSQQPKLTGSNKEVAMKYFMSQGWTRAQASGIVSNLIGESGKGLNHQIYGHGTEAQGMPQEAYGIAQWHPDRQAAFAKVYGHSIKDSTLEEQLGFVNYELTKGSRKDAGTILRGTPDAATAAYVVDRQYEGSSGVSTNQRMDDANKLFSDSATPVEPKVASLDPTAGLPSATPQVENPNQPTTSTLPVTNKFSILRGNVNGVNPKLIAVMKRASSDLPPGYTVHMISGHDSRGTGTKNHPNGLAMDVEIHDPNGKVIPNEGFGPGMKYYEMLYHSAASHGKTMYPKDKFIWGGAWQGHGAGNGDRMHYQIVDPSVRGSAQSSGSYDLSKGFTGNPYAMTPSEIASYDTQIKQTNTVTPQDAAAPNLTPSDTSQDASTGDSPELAKMKDQWLKGGRPSSLTRDQIGSDLSASDWEKFKDFQKEENTKASSVTTQPVQTEKPKALTPSAKRDSIDNDQRIQTIAPIPSSVNLALAKTALPPGKSKVATAFYRTKSRLKSGGYPLDLPTGDPDNLPSRFAFA